MNKILNKLVNRDMENPTKTAVRKIIQTKYRSQSFSVTKYLVYSTLVLGSILGPMALYRFLPIANNAHMANPEIVETIALSNLPSHTVPPLETIALQNITLQQINNHSILNLVLNSTTSYYSEFISEQQLTITLENATMPGNFPVALDRTFIASLDTKQRENQIQVTLLLLPGTTVEKLELIEEKPLSPTVRLILANEQLSNVTMARRSIPKSREEMQNEQYQEIENLVAKGKKREAIYNLYRFIGDYPEHGDAHAVLALLLMDTESWQKASDIIALGLKKHPHHLPLVKLQAKILIKNKTFSEVEKLLLRHLDHATFDVEYLSLLAFSYQQTNNFAAAVELYKQLTKLEPQQTIWWLGLGTALEKQGSIHGAREAYLQGYQGTIADSELKQILRDKINSANGRQVP